MDLAEDGPEGTTSSNAAVPLDRRCEVAGIYRKAHPGRFYSRKST